MRRNKFGHQNSLSVVRFVEQRLGRPQVKRLEALGEPVINRSEKIAGLLPSALLVPQLRQAHRSTQFPGLCLLLAGNGERTLEIRLRFRRGGLGGSWRAP
jgi:hypothetical protein